MPDRPRLVIASGNAGKLREYRDLLAGTGLELIAFDPGIDETGKTYAENARLNCGFELRRLEVLTAAPQPELRPVLSAMQDSENFNGVFAESIYCQIRKI